MITTKICKANPLGNFQKIENQAIIINRKIPSCMTLDECKIFHEKQANAINKALSESLPQGTYNLLVKFMQKAIFRK